MHEQEQLRALEKLRDSKLRELEPIRQQRLALTEKLLKATTQSEFEAIFLALDASEEEFTERMSEIRRIHEELSLISRTKTR